MRSDRSVSRVIVDMTKTRQSGSQPDYDPSQFPAFAVTVDVVILTMSDGRLHVLLVAAARRRSRGCGRSPAASSVPARRWTRRRSESWPRRPASTRASLLTQFGAYGDPGRDPRMNVVTVAYLAVLRDLGDRRGRHGRAAAALIPSRTFSSGKVELAFDHADRARRGRAGPRRARAHGHRDRVRRHDVHPGRAARRVRGRLGRAARRARTSAAASSRRPAG